MLVALRGGVQVKEVPLNDTPRDMAWCGGSMCLGLTKQYVLLDVASGQVTEVTGILCMSRSSQRGRVFWGTDAPVPPSGRGSLETCVLIRSLPLLLPP